MSENEPGAVVPAPPVADLRYEDEPGVVTRVLVEWDGGRIREYDTRYPADFTMSDPEDLATMALRPAGFSVAAGGGFTPMSVVVPRLAIACTADPRHGMHIRTEQTAGPAQGVPNG
jgi:hypothetical protein